MHIVYVSMAVLGCGVLLVILLGDSLVFNT